MTIVYKDEYGVGLFWGVSTHPANAGDTVIIEEEEYRVKSRIFIPERDEIIIIVSQGFGKSPTSPATDNDNGRLNKLSNAILGVNKRLESVEKKGRALTEQVVSVKKHINQRIQQEKKDKE